LSSTYKILSNILLSRLTPYAEEIVADHQHILQPNRSTTDRIFIKCLIKNGNTVKQCFSKKAHDSVRKEVLYYILNEFGIPMKLVKLIKAFLIETYSKVWVSKHLSDMFPN
jgi:YesN/AraC family two-component response regulator